MFTSTQNVANWLTERMSMPYQYRRVDEENEVLTIKIAMPDGTPKDVHLVLESDNRSASIRILEFAYVPPNKVGDAYLLVNQLNSNSGEAKFIFNSEALRIKVIWRLNYPANYEVPMMSDSLIGMINVCEEFYLKVKQALNA